jgi:hypothetical protein
MLKKVPGKKCLWFTGLEKCATQIIWNENSWAGKQMASDPLPVSDVAPVTTF